MALRIALYEVDKLVKNGMTKAQFEMARDYPVFGAGAGTFHTAFTRYRGPDIRAFFDHAHNDYTQFLVETGALGAALIATLPLMALVLAVLALSILWGVFGPSRHGLPPVAPASSRPSAPPARC